MVKKIKNMFALLLCVFFVVGSSSCVVQHDSSSAFESMETENSSEFASDDESSKENSSSGQDPTNKKMTKEEWVAAFELLLVVDNLTLAWTTCKMDNDLNLIYSYDFLEKFADGDKYYTRRIQTEYTDDGSIEEETTEVYISRIDGVDYQYFKDKNPQKWQKSEYPMEWPYSYSIARTDLDLWIEAYDEMTYNAETGVYRLENKVINPDNTIARTMYYMELEMRGGKIYRIEHEGDSVKGESMGMDVVWSLDGKYRTTAFHYDYGTTVVTLPEVEA